MEDASLPAMRSAARESRRGGDANPERILQGPKTPAPKGGNICTTREGSHGHGWPEGGPLLADCQRQRRNC